MSLKLIWHHLYSRKLLWILGLSMVCLVIIGWSMPVHAAINIRDFVNQDRNPPVTSLKADQIFQLSKSSTYQEYIYALSNKELIGKRWELREIRYNNGETIIVNQPDRYTLEFISDYNVKIRADCNRARGTYTVYGSRLNILVGPTTRAACPPDSISNQYLQDLGAAANYFIQDDQLYIDLRDDVGTMVFVGYQLKILQ